VSSFPMRPYEQTCFLRIFWRLRNQMRAFSVSETAKRKA
jgi:hypothetical protein